ncbi:MAG TPA: TIM barrel protein [Terriglobales bacterium]|nr:TIM barrel protein [Terriglobales bacterium]
MAGTVAAACGLANQPLLFSAESPMKSTPQDVPFDLSIMLWTVYRDLPFEQRLEKMAEAGFKNVELVGEYSSWSEDDFRRINAKRKQLGITFDCTAGLKHSLCNPAERADFVEEFRRTIPVMKKIDCPTMIVLSGNKVDGLSSEGHHQSCIDGLKAAIAVAEGKKINGQPVSLLLETIDPIENPKVYLTRVDDALEIVQAVNHPQVKLLYDFFHEQIAAGNLIAKLEKALPHLALVHVADVPGRHEPGTGEINYENIIRKLTELDYKVMIAMEFYPTSDPVSKLCAAREMALRVARETKSKKAATP